MSDREFIIKKTALIDFQSHLVELAPLLNPLLGVEALNTDRLLSYIRLAMLYRANGDDRAANAEIAEAMRLRDRAAPSLHGLTEAQMMQYVTDIDARLKQVLSGSAD